MDNNIFNGVFSPLVEHTANIARFRLNPCEIEKWLHQNHGETVDCADGCLLDSLLVATKRGYAAIYEHYVNSNMSDYLIEFQPYPSDDILENWYNFTFNDDYED